MKRNFIILFFLFTSLFASSCKTADATNTNQTTVAVETSAVNANSAIETKTLPKEVPVFTDAGEAAAMGDQYLDQGSTENAINAFRQAVKINPDFAEAYFKLGIAYSLFEKESTSTEPVEEEKPTPAKKGKKDIPKLSAADKAFENAAKVYEKILKKNPKDEQAQYNLGRAYNKLNKDKEAEKALREAVKLKPDNAEFLTELGAILMKLAQYDEAVTVLNKAVKLDDTNLQAQDLLEKADAGKKRINFGIKPKLPQQQTEENLPQKHVVAKPKPTVAPTPETETKTAPKPEPTK